MPCLFHHLCMLCAYRTLPVAPRAPSIGTNMHVLWAIGTITEVGDSYSTSIILCTGWLAHIQNNTNPSGKSRLRYPRLLHVTNTARRLPVQLQRNCCSVASNVTISGCSRLDAGCPDLLCWWRAQSASCQHICACRDKQHSVGLNLKPVTS